MVRALARRRQFLGLSQRELGKRIGMKSPVISHIEGYKSKNPGIRTIHRIAQGLGMTMSELYCAVENGNAPFVAGNVER